MAEFWAPTLWLTGGFAVLILGGELLVRGATALAAAWGVAPLLIGLTVVAFGTSAPELAVTIQSSLAGETSLALGNVVGSNICNVLFVLGMSAVLAPLAVSAQLVRRDVPIMILASLALFVLGLDADLGRLDGLLLVAALTGYTLWSVRQGRRETRAVRREFEAQASAVKDVAKTAGKLTGYFALIAVGLALLVLGANAVVDSAVTIARRLGVAELIVGLTIVAVGTSLPEVVTSIVAAIRGARDIAVGNAIGSNIMNLLGVLGISALASPSPLLVPETALWFDIPVMIVVAGATLPIFFTGHRIARWEGAIFLGYYVAYLGWLVLDATRNELISTYAFVLVAFAIPLSVITIGIGVARAIRARHIGDRIEDSS